MRIAAMLRSALGGADEAYGLEPSGERRILPRHDLTGEEFGLLVDGTRYRLRLKDLSRTGLCGLTDAPLAPGQRVFLLLDGSEGQPATICWIRGLRVGAYFPAPLDKAELQRLRAAHRLRRRRTARRATAS